MELISRDLSGADPSHLPTAVNTPLWSYRVLHSLILLRLVQEKQMNQIQSPPLNFCRKEQERGLLFLLRSQDMRTREAWSCVSPIVDHSSPTTQSWDLGGIKKHQLSHLTVVQSIPPGYSTGLEVIQLEPRSGLSIRDKEVKCSLSQEMTWWPLAV